MMTTALPEIVLRTEALRKSKIADAQKNLEKAVELYPQYASAWYELGRINDGINIRTR